MSKPKQDFVTFAELLKKRLGKGDKVFVTGPGAPATSSSQQQPAAGSSSQQQPSAAIGSQQQAGI